MVVAICVAVAFVIGVIAHQVSGKVDSPAEQLAETVLGIEGINIDFSADEKKALAEAEVNK